MMFQTSWAKYFDRVGVGIEGKNQILSVVLGGG